MSSLSTPIIKKEQRRTSTLTAADTFHENDDVDVETGILAGSDDGALPLQDQQRKRRRRYGWYIVGVIGLLFIIGVAVSVPRNNNTTTNDNDASSTTNNAADDVSLTAADVEASSSSDTTTVVMEPTIITEEEQQQPPATLEIVNDVPSSSFEGTNEEGDVVLDDNTDSAAVVPSDDKDDTINEPVYTWNPNDISSSNDMSSDATAAEDETEEEEEEALPAATVDEEEEVEDYLPLFEPEVTIGDAALLNNDIITTSSPTTLSPTTTSPTTMKPTPLPSSMPSKVPTNQVRFMTNGDQHNNCSHQHMCCTQYSFRMYTHTIIFSITIIISKTANESTIPSSNASTNITTIDQSHPRRIRLERIRTNATSHAQASL